MICAQCKDLERFFGETLARYDAARNAAYYRVCTELAAKREVDMERAKSALEEHRGMCVWAAAAAVVVPAL